MSESDVIAMRASKPCDMIKRGRTEFVVSEVANGHVWGLHISSKIPGERCRICGIMRPKNYCKPCKGSPVVERGRLRPNDHRQNQ